MWHYHRRPNSSEPVLPKNAADMDFCVFKDILDEDDDQTRPQSAPARNGRKSRAMSAGSIRGDGRPTETLEETMNKFHTTDRLRQRMKERRRTEAEIVVNETPAEILAMEIPEKKLNKTQVENVVARVCQPTAASTARTSSSKRRNARDIYVPPKDIVHVKYCSLDQNRFKGNRPLSNRAIQALVNRLSQYDSERQPPDSNRSQTPNLRQQGAIASYRWKGIKNC